MSRKTQPNELLTIPLPGEENWGNIINAALDTVDDELGKRATQADLTAHLNANAAHRASTIDCEMADSILHNNTPYLGKVEEMLRAMYGYSLGMTPHGMSLMTLYNHLHGTWAHEAATIKVSNNATLDQDLANIHALVDPIAGTPSNVTSIKLSQPADTYTAKISWDADLTGMTFADIFILFDSTEDTEIDDTNIDTCLHLVSAGNHSDYRLYEQPTGTTYMHVNVRRRNLVSHSELSGSATEHLQITLPPTMMTEAALNYMADQIITRIKDSTGNRCTRG